MSASAVLRLANAAVNVISGGVALPLLTPALAIIGNIIKACEIAEANRYGDELLLVCAYQPLMNLAGRNYNLLKNNARRIRSCYSFSRTRRILEMGIPSYHRF